MSIFRYEFMRGHNPLSTLPQKLIMCWTHIRRHRSTALPYAATIIQKIIRPWKQLFSIINICMGTSMERDMTITLSVPMTQLMKGCLRKPCGRRPRRLVSYCATSSRNGTSSSESLHCTSIPACLMCII